jgi:6-phospho-beta-glucosidase
MTQTLKIAYIGGGSFRVLPEVRMLLACKELEPDWNLTLYDQDGERVEAMAALIRQTPEARATGARVVVASSLDQAVEGADFVELTARPWSSAFFDRCEAVSRRHGFLATDNVSLSGAFLALHSAGLALEVARRMEALAPHGTMICFTNPVGLLAGAVNRGTRIRAIGICAGQTNYVHNVAYIMGWPEYDWDLEAEVAGINHVSWLMGLTLRGRDLMPEFTRKLEEGIDYDRLKHIGNYRELCAQFPRLIYAWKTFGAIHYSIEPEGLPILSFYEEELERRRPAPSQAVAAPPPPPAGRPPLVREFLDLAAADLPPTFWEQECPAWLRPPPFKACTGARVIKGLSCAAPETLATSYLNQGAIAGFPDDAIMEYSTRYAAGRIEKHATYRLPPVVNGLTHMLVEHQSLVADAIVAEDPALFLKALYAYPLCRSRQRVEAFLKDMIAANRDDLPAYISGPEGG